MGLLLFSGVAAAAGAGAQSAQAPSLPGFSATLTANNAVPAQTDDEPGITANGGPARAGVVAARSQDLGDELPFGTIIAIDAPAASATCGYKAVAPLIGYRVVTDTMNARYRDRVDVLFDTEDNYVLPSGKTMNASSLLGVCPGVSVRIVGFIDLAKHALPANQAALAKLVTGGPTTLAAR